MQKTNVRSVLDRLQQVLEAKNDSQLCTALETNRSTLGSWIARDSVPYAKCVEIASEKGISLDWLLTGEGSMRRDDVGSAPAQQAPAAEISPREQAILELFRSLDEDGQREIQDAAAEKKRLRDLEQRFKELAAAVADIKRPA